jgi:hypothetical protein
MKAVIFEGNMYICSEHPTENDELNDWYKQYLKRDSRVTVVLAKETIEHENSFCNRKRPKS